MMQLNFYFFNTAATLHLSFENDIEIIKIYCQSAEY